VCEPVTERAGSMRAQLDAPEAVEPFPNEGAFRVWCEPDSALVSLNHPA